MTPAAGAPRGRGSQRRDAARPSPARAVAARVLERVETDAAFADLALDAELNRAAVGPRDAALATELVYGTLRWQRYLDWVLAPHSRRRLPSLDTRVRVLLRVTAYQLAFLERVPAFAAVNDAVTLARSAPGVAEYVNAVLRAFARRGAAEREPAPPRDPVDALATRCSFPTWLAARWVARYGADEAEALMRALNERPPLTLRANTRRLDREALATRLRDEEQVQTRATPLAPEGLVAESGGAPGGWRAFAEGACVAQDEASMLIARLLEPAAGETVADVCAAPGTKSTHLAQLMDDRGRILALDPQPARLERVTEAAGRLARAPRRPTRLRHLLAGAGGKRGGRRRLPGRPSRLHGRHPARFPGHARRRRFRALPAAPPRHRRLHRHPPPQGVSGLGYKRGHDQDRALDPVR